jgi:hypothetical protein
MTTYQLAKGYPMKKFYALIAATGLVVTLGLSAGASTLQPTSQQIDLTKPAGYSLASCTSKAQLDCIESVALITQRNGKTSIQRGKQTGFQAEDSYDDDMGNTYFGGASTWQIKTPSGNQIFDVYAVLRTPKFITSFEGDRTNASLQVSANARQGSFDLPLQVKVRTSWLKPISIYGTAKDASWASKKIKGGELWTLTGSLSKSYYYSDNVSQNFAQNASADLEFQVWYFSISNADAGNFGSYKLKCASKGPIGYSSNAFGGGSLYWDGFSKTLDTYVTGAAFDKEGNAVLGQLKVQFSKDFVSCQWPDSKFKRAKAFRATLVDRDGNTVPAKIRVRTSSKGVVTVVATNFTHGEETYLKVRSSKK